jgi:hypothetical protein
MSEIKLTDTTRLVNKIKIKELDNEIERLQKSITEFTKLNSDLEIKLTDETIFYTEKSTEKAELGKKKNYFYSIGLLNRLIILNKLD